MNAGAGTDIDDIIGSRHGFLVVFHDHDGVAEVTQIFERFDEFSVIALMQTDTRFVENIEDAGQCRPYLRCQTDSLRFSARERTGGSRKIQIIQPDADEKTQTGFDLFDDFLGNLPFGFGERDILHECEHFGNGKTADFVDIQSADRDGKDEVGKASAVADGTGGFLDEFLIVVAAHHAHTALDGGKNALKGGELSFGFLVKIAHDVVALGACTVQERLHGGVGIIGERRVEREAEIFADGFEKGTRPGFFVHALKAVDDDGGFAQRERFIGDDFIGGQHLQIAKTGTGRAGTDGVVERKHTGFEFGKTYAVFFAGVVL